MNRKEQLEKWGAEEAKEHGLPLKVGVKLASQHIARFGIGYYPAVERLEKRLTAEKKKKN